MFSFDLEGVYNCGVFIQITPAETYPAEWIYYAKYLPESGFFFNEEPRPFNITESSWQLQFDDERAMVSGIGACGDDLGVTISLNLADNTTSNFEYVYSPDYDPGVELPELVDLYYAQDSYGEYYIWRENQVIEWATSEDMEVYLTGLESLKRFEYNVAEAVDEMTPEVQFDNSTDIGARIWAAKGDFIEFKFFNDPMQDFEIVDFYDENGLSLFYN